MNPVTHDVPKARSLMIIATALIPLLVGCSGSGVGKLGTGNTIDDQGQFSSSRGTIQRDAYAALGVGGSRLEPDTSAQTEFTVNDRVEPAGQVTLGFDVSRRFSVELHSADLGSAGFDPTGRINYHIHGASALLYAGKNRSNFKRQGLNAYGRIGVGLLAGSAVGDIDFETNSSVHALVGAGVEYMSSFGLGYRLEGIAFNEDAQFAQLGLVYRTGKRRVSPPVSLAQNDSVPVIGAAKTAPDLELGVKPDIVELGAANPRRSDDCTDVEWAEEGVRFHTNSAKLTTDAKRVLDEVAVQLNECDSLPFMITAHADNIGSTEYNLNLSKRRALSVEYYLGSRGVDRQRISFDAFGESKPIDTNSTREGRLRNRRVEFEMVGKTTK